MCPTNNNSKLDYKTTFPRFMQSPYIRPNLLFIFIFEKKKKYNFPTLCIVFLRCYDIHIYKRVYMYTILLGVSLLSKRLISISFMPESSSK